MSELEDFENIATRAMDLGFTIHLTFFRFHPEHMANFPGHCFSKIELSIIPISMEARERFGPNKNVIASTIGQVLSEAKELIDRHASGEVLAPPPKPPRQHKRLPKSGDIRLCTVEGCQQPALTKGMCSTHYQQDYRRRRSGAAA